MSVEHKKSQITIFLILGIVIVIMVVVLIAISRYSVKKTSEQEILSAKEIVFNIQPIKNFAQECLSIVSKNALNEPPDEPPNERPRDVQLKDYAERNIDTCLDFSAFLEQGFDISKKEATIDVSINENDVVFKMEYPIIINSPISGKKTQIKDFIAKHNIIHEEL